MGGSGGFTGVGGGVGEGRAAGGEGCPEPDDFGGGGEGGRNVRRVGEENVVLSQTELVKGVGEVGVAGYEQVVSGGGIVYGP